MHESDKDLLAIERFKRSEKDGEKRPFLEKFSNKLTKMKSHLSPERHQSDSEKNPSPRSKHLDDDASSFLRMSSSPLEFPATPELILEHHRKRPFLTPTEEWIIIELNEFECLVDSLNVVKIVAEHSKFFEVDPAELWQEFFDFVPDCCCYDDVVNEDVWLEFRDKKYSF